MISAEVAIGGPRKRLTTTGIDSLPDVEVPTARAAGAAKMKKRPEVPGW